MQEKWKIGSHPSMVISDTKVRNTNFPSPPNPTESPDSDFEYYGEGYLVCESVGNIRLAHLIAAAPDMLRMLQDAVKLMGAIPIPITKTFGQERYDNYVKIRSFTESLTKQVSEKEVPFADCEIHMKPLPILDEAYPPFKPI